MKLGHEDERIVRGFALFPKRLEDETIWLEFYYVRQYWCNFFGCWRSYNNIDFAEGQKYTTKEEYEQYKGRKKKL